MGIEMLRHIHMQVAVVQSVLVPLGVSAVIMKATFIGMRRKPTLVHMPVYACGLISTYLTRHGARTSVYKARN